MKTKTIITVILLLFSVTSFAQTKEQTIACIKEKLEKHGGENQSSFSITYVNIKVSPCSISFTKKYSDGNTGSQVSFNPSTAKSWTVSDDKTSIRADAKIIRCVYSSGDINNGSYLYIRNGEADIHE